MSRSDLPTVTLDAFIATAREQLDSFEREWRRAMTIKPAHFPNDLPLGDWFEQLQFFDGSTSMVDDAPAQPGG